MYLAAKSPSAKSVTVAPLSFIPLPAKPAVLSLAKPSLPQPLPLPSISPLEPGAPLEVLSPIASPALPPVPA